MKINRFIALAAIAVLVVGAMGFLSYRVLAQTDPPPGSGSEIEEGNESEDAVPADLATISAAEAEAAVLAEYPNARVLESELEYERGVLVYSVELDNGIEVSVDPHNGSVLNSGGDTEGND